MCFQVFQVAEFCDEDSSPMKWKGTWSTCSWQLTGSMPSQTKPDVIIRSAPTNFSFWQHFTYLQQSFKRTYNESRWAERFKKSGKYYEDWKMDGYMSLAERLRDEDEKAIAQSKLVSMALCKGL